MSELPNHWEEDVRQLKAAQAALAAPPRLLWRESTLAYRLALTPGLVDGEPAALPQQNCACGKAAEFVICQSDGSGGLYFRCAAHAASLECI